MKTRIFSATALAAAGLLLLAAADHPPQPAVVQIGHEKMAAAFVTGGVLWQTNNFKIQAGRRAGPGVVEAHEKDTDVFYVLEGTATFVTGGTGTEMKPLSPGESRGKEITGGEEHHLEKGDVIMIPNGVPHWFKDTSSPFTYFIVKVSQ